MKNTKHADLWRVVVIQYSVPAATEFYPAYFLMSWVCPKDYHRHYGA